MPEQPKPARIAELDALRALAAINLMLFHFTHVYSVKYGFSSPLGWEWPYGKYGVQLFFVLSGAVNAMTLLRKGDGRGFLTGRCLRILPAYYAVWGLNLLLIGLMPLAAVRTWDASEIAANLTLMPNLFGYECLEPVTWTLQVEILFYGWLLFWHGMGWLQRPFVAVGIGLLVCLGAGWGIDALLAANPEPAIGQAAGFARQLLLVDHFPLFATGILVHEACRNRGHLGACAAGVVASLLVFHVLDQRAHNPLVSVGIVGLLWMSLHGRIPVLRLRPLVFLSSISYILFLIHNNAGCVLIWHLDRHLGIAPNFCLATAVVCSIAAAAALSMAVERPLVGALKRQLGRVHWRSSPAAASAGGAA